MNEAQKDMEYERYKAKRMHAMLFRRLEQGIELERIRRGQMGKTPKEEDEDR